MLSYIVLRIRFFFFSGGEGVEYLTSGSAVLLWEIKSI